MSISCYAVFLFWSLIRVCRAETSSPQPENKDVSHYAWNSQYFEATELPHTCILTSLCRWHIHKKREKDLLHLLSRLKIQPQLQFYTYSCINTGKLWCIVSGYNCGYLRWYHITDCANYQLTLWHHANKPLYMVLEKLIRYHIPGINPQFGPHSLTSFCTIVWHDSCLINEYIQRNGKSRNVLKHVWVSMPVLFITVKIQGSRPGRV